MLPRSVFESASLEESVELRLVDSVDWSKAHRNRRELPEIWHQPWVRVARKTSAGLWTRLFLTEVVHFISRNSAL